MVLNMIGNGGRSFGRFGAAVAFGEQGAVVERRGAGDDAAQLFATDDA
jgi:hypothetical protein